MPNVVNAGFEVIEKPKAKDSDVFIERVGRLCYKSEDKITDESAKKFVEMLLGKNHVAMVEHYNYLFEVSDDIAEVFMQPEISRFLVCTPSPNKGYFISGSATAIRELALNPKNNDVITDIVKDYATQLLFRVYNTVMVESGKALDFLVSGLEEKSYLSLSEGDFRFIDSDDTLLQYGKHIKNIDDLKKHATLTVKYCVDRGVTHEIVRHRISSYGQESTRYCNYSKNKFGNCVTSIDIKPAMLELVGKTLKMPDGAEFVPTMETVENWYNIWLNAIIYAEKFYMNLTAFGCPAQLSRGVLPHSTKAEIIMTASLWEMEKVFFELRTAESAHPQMREVVIPTKQWYYSELERELEALK